MQTLTTSPCILILEFYMGQQSHIYCCKYDSSYIFMFVWGRFCLADSTPSAHSFKHMRTRTHTFQARLPSFRALSLRGIRASEDSLTYYLVNMHSSGLVSQGLPYTVNTCKGPRIWSITRWRWHHHHVLWVMTSSLKMTTWIGRPDTKPVRAQGGRQRLFWAWKS